MSTTLIIIQFMHGLSLYLNLMAQVCGKSCEHHNGPIYNVFC